MNDVDPTHPRIEGNYGRFLDDLQYCVSDDLAETVLLGLAMEAEPGDD